MLDLQTDIIQRIQDHVQGLVTVANPSVLVGMRDIGLLLPAAIIVPGSGEPDEQKIPSLPMLEHQEWTVVVIVAHQATNTDNGLTEQIAGGFMTAILKALHGKKEPGWAQKYGFIYKGRKEPDYNLGYAEFPMTFVSKAVIGI